MIRAAKETLSNLTQTVMNAQVSARTAKTRVMPQASSSSAGVGAAASVGPAVTSSAIGVGLASASAGVDPIIATTTTPSAPRRNINFVPMAPAANVPAAAPMTMDTRDIQDVLEGGNVGLPHLDDLTNEGP